MDWNNNSVIFASLNLPDNYYKKCSHCMLQCTCKNVQIQYNYGQVYYCSSVEEYISKIVEIYKSDEKRGYVKYKLSIPLCNCPKCTSGIPCNNVITDHYNNKLKILKNSCELCNAKSTCSCFDGYMHVFGIYYIANSELEKSNLDDIVFQIVLFKIAKSEFDKLQLERLNFGQLVNWFFENVPIYKQTSMYSTINIYDDSFLDHATEILKYYSNSRIIYNHSFRGYASYRSYYCQLESLLKTYSNPNTYKLAEPKTNPHVARNKRTPKLRK